jgi:MYXO-CTERM domain-containing protein
MGIDNFSLVPAPGAAATLSLAAIALGRRRR